MDESHDLPYQAEYAKSGRAGCKGCRITIDKDSLRLAVMVQSPHFDGKMPNWFHYECFWKKNRITNDALVRGFNSLRWDDQQKIKDRIGGNSSSAGGGGGKKAAAVTVDGLEYGDFAVEYAKSNRSTCRHCNEKIDKDVVRVSIKEYGESPYGPQDLWHHLKCFVEKREELGFTEEMQPSGIPGFGNLQKDDQTALLKQLGKGKKVTKRKGEKSEESSSSAAKKTKIDDPEEAALKEQSKSIWDVRDVLSKEVSNDGLKGLLEYNGQELPSGESKLLDTVTDCMVFGVPEKCPECKGQLRLGNSGYHCTGNVTEWTKCQYRTIKPKRKAFKVPKEYHDVDFLKNYKYSARERIFPKGLTSPPVASNAGNGESSKIGEASDSKLPLSGMKFCAVGKMKITKAVLTKKITELGGAMTTKIDAKLTAVISAKADEKNQQITSAKAADVHVVDEGFLDDVAKMAAGGGVAGIADLIKMHSISSWGSEPLARINKGAEKVIKKSGAESSAEAKFLKSMPGTLKMKMKGGAVIDADSELEDVAHVYNEKGDIYNAVLGLVNISTGTNSYYKLQLLEADKGTKYWVFRAWGRVGTTIGGKKVENFKSKEDARDHFTSLYLEKTGNEWHRRKHFTKSPGKFHPLDIDYGGDDEALNKKLSQASGTRSKLAKEVQEFIRLILNVESMKKAMLEFEIDMKKMPLGKLSKKQIESAYKILTEVQGLIEKGGTATKFLDASNRFYTLIPHDFGLKKLPLLDNAELVKTKTEMLDNLLEIEVAYNLLKTGDEADKDPLDVQYENLKTDIKVLDKGSKDYGRLLEYVSNTHAATHNQYELDVKEIFEISRHDERKRFEPFKNLHNRMLLWHGSRSTNFGGIFSQGLRIAPPEAPVTGYMFGKGIYFADMVSKSANYCCTNKSNPTGVLLLCEVALGDMYELTGAKFISSLPAGFHSTKGCGMTEPDFGKSYVTPDGVQIPMGKGVMTKTKGSSLLYNEYIVYDINQVNIRYALKVDFKYKW